MGIGRSVFGHQLTYKTDSERLPQADVSRYGNSTITAVECRKRKASTNTIFVIVSSV